MELTKASVELFFQIQNRRPKQDIGRVLWHPSTEYYLVAVSDGGEEGNGFKHTLISHLTLGDKFISEAQDLCCFSSATSRETSSSRSEALGCVKSLIALKDTMDQIRNLGIKLKRENVILGTDSQVLLFWVRSTKKLKVDCSFVIAKVKVILAQLGLSAVRNFYFWNQEAVPFTVDQLTKYKKIPKSADSLKGFDILMDNSSFLKPRSTWQSFLSSELCLPAEGDYTSLFEGYRLSQPTTTQEIEFESCSWS